MASRRSVSVRRDGDDLVSSTSPSSTALSLQAILNSYRTSTSSQDNTFDSSSTLDQSISRLRFDTGGEDGEVGRAGESVLAILLPLLIVLSTLLFLVLVFLICVLVLKRKRGIRLGDDSGPVDLSQGEGVYGDGGVEGVEARWLEGQDEDVRRGYRRAKDWQLHYPPSSIPTDITLSQFLTIQEKGVSAWCFEPDYESNPSLYVQSRTEITFLADGPGMPTEEGGGNSVMANLPLPKLNEVYYFECKMYEKPVSTDVAIGLATKPYPSFRLPGWNKYSVAYHSDGFKAHNYPFTAASYGPPLAQGDVLGVGYRPRTGTVFFTRNGRKHEDAFVGLQRFNLFPTIGASGPATIHVNLGQAGFVFIEANVKKWGLAPSIGTLAPPPAYGSERGSILLEAGFGASAAGSEAGGSTTPVPDRSGGGRVHGRAHSGGSFFSASSFGSSSSTGSGAGGLSAISVGGAGSSDREHRRTHRSRRPKVPSASTTPIHPSPLRLGNPGASSSPVSSRPTPAPTPPIAGPSTVRTRSRVLTPPSDVSSPYISPVDRDEPRVVLPASASPESSDDEARSEDELYQSADEAAQRAHEEGIPGEPESADDDTEYGSPLPHNPPTPNLLDISLHSLREQSAAFFGGRGSASRPSSSNGAANADHRLSTITSSSSEGTDSTSSTARPRGSHARSITSESVATATGTDPSSEAAAQAPGTSHAREVSPPGYSPLDQWVYSAGVPTDLPASMISAAFEAAERGENEDLEAQRRAENESRRGGPLAWFGGRTS